MSEQQVSPTTGAAVGAASGGGSRSIVMWPPVSMSTSAPRSRKSGFVHEVRSRPHPERSAVGFGLVTEEDAGEQGEGIGRDLVGALPHVPVDVRAAGAVAVGRDVQTATWM